MKRWRVGRAHCKSMGMAQSCHGGVLPRALEAVRSFHADERGVVSILGAFFLVLALSVSVLVIDVGHLYLEKRRLQSAVDAAALAAAGNPQRAGVLVQSALARNGYRDTAATVTTGTYTADPAVAAPERLDTGSGLSPNAVRVTKSIYTPDFLAGIFSAHGQSRITATATATRIPSVSFSTGAGLLNLSAGDLNAALGGLLGTNLSLGLVDYNGLVATNVDALGFLNRLATQLDLSAGTYGDMANANVTMGQIISAAQAELNMHPQSQAGAALTALNILSLQVPQGVSTSLGSLIDTALWQKRTIGSIVQQDSGQTVVNLFDMVTAMARLYGAGHIADLGTGLSIPVTNTAISAYLSAGEPMASITNATIGAGLSTSQVRLALTVTAANVDLGLARATVRLPVYVEMATGSAQVDSISCQANGTMASIRVTPMTVRAQIGQVAPNQLSDYGVSPQPQPAGVVALSVLGIPITIQADALASVAAGPDTVLDFSQDDIDAGTVRAAGADTQHLLSSLASDLQLTVKGSGLTSVVNNLVAGTVMPILRPLLVSILSSLDPVVAKLLQATGIELGKVSVAVHGVNCGRPTIVG